MRYYEGCEFVEGCSSTGFEGTPYYPREPLKGPYSPVDGSTSLRKRRTGSSRRRHQNQRTDVLRKSPALELSSDRGLLKRQDAGVTDTRSSLPPTSSLLSDDDADSDTTTSVSQAASDDATIITSKSEELDTTTSTTTSDASTSTQRDTTTTSSTKLDTTETTLSTTTAISTTTTHAQTTSSTVDTKTSQTTSFSTRTRFITSGTSTFTSLETATITGNSTQGAASSTSNSFSRTEITGICAGITVVFFGVLACAIWLHGRTRKRKSMRISMQSSASKPRRFYNPWSAYMLPSQVLARSDGQHIDEKSTFGFQPFLTDTYLMT